MRRGIIILEGPDASGKTTLAKGLFDYYMKTPLVPLGCPPRFQLGYTPVQFIARSGPRRNIGAYQLAALHKALGFDGITIIDRHWISEEVYGSVYRPRVTPVSFQTSRFMFDMLLNLPCLYVMCNPAADKAPFLHVATMEQGIEQRFKEDDRMEQVRRLFRLIAGDACSDRATPTGLANGSLAMAIARNGGMYRLAESFPYLIHALSHDVTSEVGRWTPEAVADVMRTTQRQWRSVVAHKGQRQVLMHEARKALQHLLA